jgi:deazaflavin-dependent oxidoreductase (nitroreductase family)
MSRNAFYAISRYFLAVYVFLYRLTGGKFGSRVQGLPVLLLTTIGRKTGKKRVTPLGYIKHASSYVITATNAGSDAHPAWFLNLKSHPPVAFQVGNKQFTAIAEPAGPDLRKQLWAEIVERAPGYGAYEKRTTRQFPVVLLRPVPGAESR